MKNRLIDTQVASARRAFQQPTPVLSQIDLVSPQQIRDVKALGGESVAQVLEGFVQFACNPEKLVGKASEQPLLNKGTGEFHIIPCAACLFPANHAIHVQIINVFVIVLELYLFIRPEHVQNERPVGLLPGFADDVKDIAVRQNIGCVGINSGKVVHRDSLVGLL